jgi:hypothetical protein
VATLTRRLESAFARAARLSAEEQDALASAIVAEMDEARRWDELLAQPRSVLLLEQLASVATAEDAAGLTEPLESLFLDELEDDRGFSWAPTLRDERPADYSGEVHHLAFQLTVAAARDQNLEALYRLADR